MTLRTPAQWSALGGLLIRDRDGWRLDDKDWNEPIDKDEFLRRCAASTVERLPSGWPEIEHAGWKQLQEAVEHFESAPAAPHYIVAADHGRPDWDTYFVDIARAVAARADCRRRKVGAVIVGPDHFILSTGYNGAPPGEPGCLSGACPRGLLSYDEVKEFSDYGPGQPGHCISLHAELNAVVQIGRRGIPAGSTIYITDQPCDGCSKAIAAAGITRIITPGGIA